jgi:RNA polymerase sigma factor (sigma-70 family)
MGPADPYGSEGIATLVEAFQKGDREERSRIGEQIALRFEPVVRRAWRELIRGRSSVEYEDFAQDVFVRVFSSLGQLRTPAAFPGYFRSIARNVAVDALRRQGARPEFADVDPDIVGARLDHSILAAVLVRSYLELLPPGQREVLDLEYVEGLDPEAIMERTGLSRGGISAAKTRAIKRLQEICRKEAEALSTPVAEEKAQGGTS